MPIPFKCPHCGSFTEVDDQFAGHTGPCATCGKEITVPRVSAEVRAERVKKVKKSASFLIIASVCGVVVISLVLIGMLLASSLVPSLALNSLGDHEAQCAQNLIRIAAALEAYHADHGNYPPAFLADEDGKPMHSWRVLLLPYLDEQLLYDQYDFDEPWDGPTNMRLVSRMPSVYGCPDDPEAPYGETSYIVVIGEGTMFPGEETKSASAAKDGKGETALIAEVVSSSITWTEPKDLALDNMKLKLDGSAGELGSNHEKGCVHVLMADGTIQHLDDSTSGDELRKMFTCDDGAKQTPVNAP